MSDAIVLLHGSANGSCSWGPIRGALVRALSATSVVVPGAGHMIPLTHPAAVIAAIQREVTS